MTRLAATAVSLLVALLVAACSSVSPGASAAPGAGGGGLQVTAWARATQQVGSTGAAYLTIVNGTDAADRLLSASTAVATTVEIHRSMSSDGMMGMEPVEDLEIGAGQTVTMAPGDLHLMLVGLTRELAAGSRFDIVLTFEKAGDVTVAAEVRAG